ncbi:hypothetical protein DH2020_028450 [Rehmannia glutinosa]|uniref:Uncharacterized protein n=1 Tax=Rehmannia glutinosa TaxID=99300 RepID=A0ABR0VUX9_REHGL
MVHMADAEIHVDTKVTTEDSLMKYPRHSLVIQKEVAKFMSRTDTGGVGGHQENAHSFSHFVEYGGTNELHFALSSYEDFGKNNWIIDTGASKHMDVEFTDHIFPYQELPSTPASTPLHLPVVPAFPSCDPSSPPVDTYPSPSIPTLGRSTRTRQPPSWHSDYHMSASAH